jgi:hypothetical protein
VVCDLSLTDIQPLSLSASLLLLDKKQCIYYVHLNLFLDPTASADLAVILMQEGLAHVFLIGKRYVKAFPPC